MIDGNGFGYLYMVVNKEIVVIILVLYDWGLWFL